MLAVASLPSKDVPKELKSKEKKKYLGLLLRITLPHSDCTLNFYLWFPNSADDAVCVGEDIKSG